MRLRDIVGDIIELSSLDEGYKGENEEINVRNTVETEIKKLEHKADDNSVGVENYVSSSLIIIGIPKVFSEVISNLLDNAIRYNKKGGWVKVESKGLGEKIEISVSDNGIGIPKDSIERVFERFYRVDKSRSKATGGTGLGLAIVKHIVDLHDARITLDSKLNVGTTMTVYF